MRITIVGGGTMGLASAWALSRRGAEVTVLERFGHVNALSSHGGFTRVIRQAYHEGSDYVPLVRESTQAWRELEGRAGEALLVRTGLLEFGPADDPELAAAVDVCRRTGVEHEEMTPAQAAARWPFRIPNGWTVCLSPDGGYLRVPACLDAFRREAEAAGATMRHGVRVSEVGTDGSVTLEDGERVLGDKVIVAAGPWVRDLLADAGLDGLFRLRRVLAWSRPAPQAQAALASMPVWGAFLRDGFFYGFPYGEYGTAGCKLACHTTTRAEDGGGHLSEPIEPETVDREVHARDLDPLRRFLEAHIPSAAGEWAHHCVCMYGCTPNWDFLVDRLPGRERVIVAGGFSGHGFKFAPAIGRLLAELALDDAAPHADFSFATHFG